MECHNEHVSKENAVFPTMSTELVFITSMIAAS